MKTKNELSSKFVILLDNSFRELYCFFDDSITLHEMQSKWNIVIDNICLKLPFFSNDYPFVDIPLCIFESIGLRNLCFDIKIKEYFPKASDMLIPATYFEDGNEEQAINYLDQIIENTFNKLVDCFAEALNPQKIIEKIDNKLKSKKLHKHVQNLKTNMLQCKEDLQKMEKSIFHQQLCRDLAWNALVKYSDWNNASDDIKFAEIQKSNKEFKKFTEIQIVKRLIAYYLNNNKKNDYLAGSVLFHKYARLTKNKKGKDQLNPYKERELIDPYLIEYIFVGYCDQETDQRKKVIVITCDETQQIRVENHVSGYRAIKQELEDNNLGVSKLMFGYLIIIDSKTHQVKHFFDGDKIMNTRT